MKHSSIFYRTGLNCIAAAMFIFLAGCSTGTRTYPELPRIPDYPENTWKYNTAAIIDLRGNGDPGLTQSVRKRLEDLKYTLVSNGTYYKGSFPENVTVLQILNLSHFVHEQADGMYLQTRVVVMVRPPGVLWKKELNYGNARYFQAYFQQFFGRNPILPENYEKGMNRAVENLFRIHPFRSALEPASARKNIPVIRENDAVSYWERSKYYQIHEPVRKFEALRWAYHAARLGNREAQIYIARQALYSELCGDNKRLFSLVVFLSNAGLSEAQNKLALMYDLGLGVPADASMAFRWYSKAAEQGLPIALYNVGQCYEQGTGVPMDLQKAAEYYRRAEQAGYKPAGEHYQKVLKILEMQK